MKSRYFHGEFAKIFDLLNLHSSQKHFKKYINIQILPLKSKCGLSIIKGLRIYARISEVSVIF